jgi:hypothetical protein
MKQLSNQDDNQLHLESLKNAFDVALQSMWTTIDSAPRDGTHIYVYNKHDGYTICWWDSYVEMSTQETIYGWMSDLCVSMGGFERPTHWIPLPEFRG